METVYAIFDDADECVYLCYQVEEDEYEQCEEMNEWNWEEFLSND